MIRFFGNKELENFKKIRDIEKILVQIILYNILEKNQKENPRPLLESIFSVRMVVGESSLNVLNMDKNKLKKIVRDRKTYISNILDFYEKNEIWMFPIYLSIEKSPTCYGFVLRILNKYSSYNLKEPIMPGDKKNKTFETKFYEYITTLEKNKILYEIKKERDIELGDLIIYCKNNIEYFHIGLVYNSKFEIIIKVWFFICLSNSI